MTIRLSSKRHDGGWITAFLVALIWLAIGLFLIIKLWQVINHVIPDPPPPAGQTNQDGTISYQDPGLVNSISVAGLALASPTNPAGFTVIYGWDAQGLRFLSSTNSVLEMDSSPARQVTLLRSSSLTNWVALATNSVASGTWVIFTDYTCPSNQAFYLLSCPP